jgi:hypothetical protein
MILGRRFLLLATAGISLIPLLLISCLGSGSYKIIPEKKFVDVLVDLHLADAIADQSMIPDMTYQLDSASLYGSVFKKHGITKAQFDTTMIYYSKRPDDLQKLYNTVTARLKHMEEEVVIAQAELNSQYEEVIWQDSRILSFPPLAGSRVEINVPVKGTGLYTVSATVKLYADDASLNPRMSVYFFQDNNTPEGNRDKFTESMYTARNGQYKIYTASKQLTNLNFTGIKGFIANYSNADTMFRRHMDVKEIKITRKK